MERMANPVLREDHADICDQYELIPCGLEKPFHSYTNVRLIYCPKYIAEKLELKQIHTYRRVYDLRIRDSSIFLEYVIGVAQTGPLRAQDVTMGYSLPKETWYLNVPQGGHRSLFVISPSVKGLFYRLFYDYILDNVLDQDFREETTKIAEQTRIRFT